MLVRPFCRQYIAQLSDSSTGELKAANANLTLVIQADMLAYRLPGEPPQLGLPDLYVTTDFLIAPHSMIYRIGTPELAQLVSNISAIYSPELVVGVTQVRISVLDFRRLRFLTSVLGVLQ